VIIAAMKRVFGLEKTGLLTKFLSESGKESGTICTKTLELVILNTKN
jgi:hypothetical protein